VVKAVHTTSRGASNVRLMTMMASLTGLAMFIFIKECLSGREIEEC